jgi:hypothetical protein
MMATRAGAAERAPALARAGSADSSSAEMAARYDCSQREQRPASRLPRDSAAEIWPIGLAAEG